jgi:hypothetical protein
MEMEWSKMWNWNKVEWNIVEWSVMEQAKAKRALIGIYSSSASSASLYPLKCKGLFSTYKSVDRLTKEPTYYINIKSELLRDILRVIL